MCRAKCQVNTVVYPQLSLLVISFILYNIWVKNDFHIFHFPNRFCVFNIFLSGQVKVETLNIENRISLSKILDGR